MCPKRRRLIVYSTVAYNRKLPPLQNPWNFFFDNTFPLYCLPLLFHSDETRLSSLLIISDDLLFLWYHRIYYYKYWTSKFQSIDPWRHETESKAVFIDRWPTFQSLIIFHENICLPPSRVILRPHLCVRDSVYETNCNFVQQTDNKN